MNIIIPILFAIVFFSLFGLILYLVKYKRRGKQAMSCHVDHQPGEGQEEYDHDPCPDCTCGRLPIDKKSPTNKE